MITLTVDDNTFFSETTFMIDNATSPTNPNLKILSQLTVSFDGNLVDKGRYLGFRLATPGGNNNFKFTTTSPDFSDITPLIIANSNNPNCSSTIIWSADTISGATIISSIPISIECVSESFPSEATVSYSVQLYTAISSITLQNLELIGEVSMTTSESTARQLSVTVVIGKINSTLQSFYPNDLSLPNNTFDPSEDIALKTTLIKDSCSCKIESLVLQVTLPSTHVNYSSGKIYISKVNNTNQITDFNDTAISSANYYSANLNSNSNGIDVTTTPGTIILTLSDLDTAERTKFISTTDGVIFPLYVFITGVIS